MSWCADKTTEPTVPVSSANVTISSSSDICAARQRGRAVAKQMGFSPSETTLLATVISELGRDILMRADFGEITCESLCNGDRVGIRLTASYGTPPFLSEPNVAVDERAASSWSDRVSREVKQFMDEMEFRSSRSAGAAVTGVKWCHSNGATSVQRGK